MRRPFGWSIGFVIALVGGACARQGLRPPTEAIAGYAHVLEEAAERLEHPLGPVPDYSPVGRITTHTDLASIAPTMAAILSAALGPRHVITHHAWPAANPEPGEVDALDDSAVWMRDYQPIFVRRRDGRLSALYYLSPNPSRSQHRFEHLPADVRVEELPIIHENGNLVATNSYVFFAETMFEDNREQSDLPHLQAAGYQPRSETQILKLLSRAFDRPSEDLIVMPAMPYESTGHIDIYLLPLDDDTVMIPRLDESDFGLLGADPSERRVAKVIATFLDEQAAHMRSLGMKVVRMPMVPPSIERPDASEPSDEDFELVVYTPANSLLVNTGGRKLVFIPSFEAGTEEIDRLATFARYRRQWADSFRAAGWEPHFVDASELVTFLGLLRCVTATVPR